MSLATLLTSVRGNAQLLAWQNADPTDPVLAEARARAWRELRRLLIGEGPAPLAKLALLGRAEAIIHRRAGLMMVTEARELYRQRAANDTALRAEVAA